MAWDHHPPPLNEQRWHAGGPGNRVILAENDEAIGMMDTSLWAAQVAEEHNAIIDHRARSSEFRLAA